GEDGNAGNCLGCPSRAPPLRWGEILRPSCVGSADSLQRQRQAGQHQEIDGAGRIGWRAGRRSESRSEILRVHCEFHFVNFEDIVILRPSDEDGRRISTRPVAQAGEDGSHSGKGIPGWWYGANRTTTEPIQRTAARPPK